MSRSVRVKGSQGRLLPVISPLDLNQRSKGEAAMCEIIQFPISARVPPSIDPFYGMIDVYRGENGKVGIDACVSSALAVEMYGEILPGIISLLDNGEGTVGFDAQISERAADIVLAAAKRAGVSIRH